MLHSAHSTRPTRASRTHPIPPRTLAVEQDFKLQLLFIPYDSCSEFASAAKSRIASRPTPFSFILGGTTPFHSHQVFWPHCCLSSYACMFLNSVAIMYKSLASLEILSSFFPPICVLFSAPSRPSLASPVYSLHSHCSLSHTRPSELRFKSTQPQNGFSTLLSQPASLTRP